MKTTGEEGLIAVVPNPIQSSTINLVFENLEAGNYSIKLINNGGMVVHSSLLNHTGGSATNMIKVNHNLPSGIYNLVVKGVSGIKNIQVLVE